MVMMMIRSRVNVFHNEHMDTGETKGPINSYGEGAYKTAGGGVKFYPYEKGTENVLAMLKGKEGGGVTTSFGVVLTWVLEV